MRLAVVLLLATVAAVVQVGVLPAAVGHPLAAPVLPAALIAGWGAARPPREVWPAPVIAAVVLGSVSELRVAAVLLALLPAACLAVAFRTPRRQGSRLLRPLLLALGGGAAGAICYVALLAVTTGEAWVLAAEVSAIAGAALWTAVIAMTLAALVWPFGRPRTGLFG
ncbi:MAG: hypothetical protein WD734_00990 [Dehalococcoidia bacterium]